MRRFLAILGGLALMLLAVSQGHADESAYSPAADEGARRSAYSYVRSTSGEVTVVSPYNGRVTANRNMPISTGDEVAVSEGGRAEVALADGNLLEIGGGTRARFESLAAQQGDEDSVSGIRLIEGSVILAAVGSGETEIPRIDTEEATIYLNSGARVRVNADPRRGTEVIARSGNTEVRTPQGSFRLRAGEYLLARPEREAEIERGVFSHDRFDIWAEDRLGTLSDSRSASARYVDSDYAGDVASMDGYGDWSYSPEYERDVWSPRVDAGWTPYSYGSWYYTPAGMTWWSSDPWGWYPFHYGSWFFSLSGNRWCWSPGSVYSPAWVYWGFSAGFVGWCPIGFYSNWSPWFGGSHRQVGWWNRPGVSIAINGTFPTRGVDFRGWNFVGSRGFGTNAGRMDVISGSRIRDRLGANPLAISSRPIVVAPRAGGVREAIQTFVREAPRTIERNAPSDSARLAPILAHQRTLPPETLAAVEQRAVVAGRGRLAGPGVADVAPRGVLVDRNRSLSEIASHGSTNERSNARVAPDASVSRAPVGSRTERPEAAVREGTDWRTRSFEPREANSARSSRRPDARTIERARPGEEPAVRDWRSRSRTESATPRGSSETVRRDEAVRRDETVRRESWRSRQEMPPARRVIEGAVPGRRSPAPTTEQAPRQRAWRESAPPPAREFRAEPRQEFRPPAREFRAEPRQESRPESRPPAPAPHVERAPVHSAPAPRAEPRHAAPPPQRGRPDR